MIMCTSRGTVVLSKYVTGPRSLLRSSGLDFLLLPVAPALLRRRLLRRLEKLLLVHHGVLELVLPLRLRVARLQLLTVLPQPHLARAVHADDATVSHLHTVTHTQSLSHIRHHATNYAYQ